MSDRQLGREDVHNFLLPYRSRVYDPFELMAKIRSSFEGWEENGQDKLILTFKLKDVVDDEREVYGVSEEIMNMLGAWRSPMSGKNWWVNPTNPDARSYSDISVECPNCSATFGGTQHKNSHQKHCSPSVNREVRSNLREKRLDWLDTAARYCLDIERASRRLGLKPQTVRDMVWEEDGFSYEDRKREGRETLATTWHIARDWGTDHHILAEATGYSESTVHSYISRYSQVKDDMPSDPTSNRASRR
ncbi:hypothetical protein HCTV5_40 [Halovirus HCTV-5]|uniref:hypothetical protein n=1 Tax=Halovirus HCTV-5 TaxID=1273748 RepID=UPI000334823D|nr:hypothetical protein M200_gp040 [Halovirus HCTV-5]AGM11650.1 hypothetical protein HCTV5_40 [Halovirus HCTV-5]